MAKRGRKVGTVGTGKGVEGSGVYLVKATPTAITGRKVKAVISGDKAVLKKVAKHRRHRTVKVVSNPLKVRKRVKTRSKGVFGTMKSFMR